MIRELRRRFKALDAPLLAVALFMAVVLSAPLAQSSLPMATCGALGMAGDVSAQQSAHHESKASLMHPMAVSDSDSDLENHDDGCCDGLQCCIGALHVLALQSDERDPPSDRVVALADLPPSRPLGPDDHPPKHI